MRIETREDALREIMHIMEPLIWAQHDLEDFHSFISSVKTELTDKLVEEIFSHLNDLQYDINAALDKIHYLIG